MGGPAKENWKVEEECQRNFFFLLKFHPRLTPNVEEQFVSKYIFSITDMVSPAKINDTQIFVCFLTVHSEGDLSLPDSDPRDNGFAHVLAGIGLAHGLQIQLVAVTQNLEVIE